MGAELSVPLIRGPGSNNPWSAAQGPGVVFYLARSQAASIAMMKARDFSPNGWD
jgi:hypothetical protein